MFSPDSDRDKLRVTNNRIGVMAIFWSGMKVVDRVSSHVWKLLSVSLSRLRYATDGQALNPDPDRLRRELSRTLSGTSEQAPKVTKKRIFSPSHAMRKRIDFGCPRKQLIPLILCSTEF